MVHSLMTQTDLLDHSYLRDISYNNNELLYEIMIHILFYYSTVAPYICMSVSVLHIPLNFHAVF